MSNSFLQGYLFAYIFWVGLTLGCLGLLLLFNTTRGRWGFPVVRLLEAGAKMLPIMLLLFIPILLAVWHGQLYPWADPAKVQADKVLLWRQKWMNPGMFIGRTLFYFVVWMIFAFFLSKWSLEQDRTGDPTLAQKRMNLAAPGIVIGVITITFAFTDWVMSLDPHWYSTIYGFWWVDSQCLSALAFVTIIGTWAGRKKPYTEVVTAPVLRDIGNLMLTLTMVWAYFSISQYLIIYAANLPEEVTYFIKRNQGPGWLFVTTWIVMFQFFVPFLALLSGRTKRTPQLMFSVSVIIIITRVLDVFWVVAPFFYEVENGHLNLDPSVIGYGALCFVVMGLIWYIGFRFWLGRASLLPVNEPRLVEVYEHA